MAMFYVVAIRETDNWDAQWLQDHGILEAFGLYLVRQGEATFCCEITPSSRADFVSNAFILSDEAKEEDSERECAEYDDGGQSTSYIRFFDPAKMDPRFYAELGDPAIECPDDASDADSEWECAREWQSSNPVEPHIIWDDHFAEFRAEQSAKRRAENRATLDSREQLPLFAAAAMAMRDSYDRAEFRRMGWL